MSELKPCPFCGQPAEVQDWWRSECGTVFYVTCTGMVKGTGCRLSTGAYQSVKDACDMWNTRPIEDGLQAGLEKRTAELHYANTACMEMKHELDRLNAERRWIPVSERLPEYGEPSLTIYHTKNATSQITIRCLVEDRDDKLRVIWYDIENGLWVNGNNITHWMPLPEPPNADDYVGDSDHEHDDRIL